MIDSVCSLHLDRCKECLPQRKNIEKNSWEVDILGHPHGSNSGNPDTIYITNLLQETLALIAITSAQSRPAVGAGAVPAGIRNITTPAPNSKEPLTTFTTT